jgi:hypothetical protein
MKTFIGIFVILAVFIVPNYSQASTIEQKTTIEEVKESLIQLLLQQIAMPQAQIDELIAKQGVIEDEVIAIEKTIKEPSVKKVSQEVCWPKPTSITTTFRGIEKTMYIIPNVPIPCH